MSELTEAVMSNPKTSLLVAAFANASNWWVEWGNPIVDAAASILSLVLVITLIRYHLHKTKAILDESKKKVDKKDWL